MTESEKLKALIQKAIDGGWKGPVAGYYDNKKPYYWGSDILSWEWDDTARLFSQGSYDDYEELRLESIIFNHDFAKALWGEKQLSVDYIDLNGKGNDFYYEQYIADGTAVYGLEAPAHLFHLQQAVISDDPIGYMYNAVFGGEQ